MPPTAHSPTTAEHAVYLRIRLPESILAEYDAQATSTSTKHAIEEFLAMRLVACVNHTAEKPLYFSDKQRQDLEQLLGKNVLNTNDALLQVRNAMSVRIGKVIIGLKLNLLQKLKSRCIGMEWEAFLEQRITQELERYAGMR